MKSKKKKSSGGVGRQSSYRQAVGNSVFYSQPSLSSIPAVIEQTDSSQKTNKAEANNNSEFREKTMSARACAKVASGGGDVNSNSDSDSAEYDTAEAVITTVKRSSDGDMDSGIMDLQSSNQCIHSSYLSGGSTEGDADTGCHTSDKSHKITTNRDSLESRVYDDVALESESLQKLPPMTHNVPVYDDVALDCTVEQATDRSLHKGLALAATNHRVQTTRQVTGASSGAVASNDDTPTSRPITNAASSAVYDDVPQSTDNALDQTYYVLTPELARACFTMPQQSDTLTTIDTIYEPVEPLCENSDENEYDDDDDDDWSSSEFEPIENSTEFVVQRTPNFLEKARHRISLPFMKPKSRNLKGKSFTFDVEKHPAPQLCDFPDGLTDKQKKRRHVVASIVEIENSYVQSLILLNESYKIPLLQNGIIGRDRVETMFFKLDEILDCHLMFRIALHDRIRNWDDHELLGDDFSGICKALVLESYSEFVNNFMTATDLLRRSLREKSIFTDFVNRQMKNTSDMVGPHGQMIKVVQRFPQYILQIKDLIKHTPPDHDDYLRLNIALSKLENVAYQLNERKRSSEERLAARVMLTKLNIKNPVDDNILLQRMDDVTEVAHGSRGEVLYMNNRRLLLFNDLICLIKIDDSGSEEKIKAKWTCPTRDVEYDESGSSSSSNSLVRGSSGSVLIQNNTGPRRSSDSTGKFDESTAVVHKELEDLMHDETVLSQIIRLSLSLRNEYKTVNSDLLQEQLKNVQTSIRIRDEQLQMLDSCSISLSYTKNGQKGKIQFNMTSPARKQDWVMDFRAVKLAQEASNHVSRCWLTDVEKANYPLFVRNVNVDITSQCTQVTCATPIFLTNTTCGIGLQYLWVCSSNDEHGQVTLLSIHSNQPHIIESFKACNGTIDCCMLVPSNIHTSLDHVWMSDSTNHVYVHSLRDGEWRSPCRLISVPSRVKNICCYGNYVFLALADGSVLKYSRKKGSSTYSEAVCRRLTDGHTPVNSLLPCDNNRILAACGHALYVLSVVNEDLSTLDKHEFKDLPESSSIDKMIRLGYGIWFSCSEDPSLRLIHHETYKNISEVHIGSALARLVTDVGSVDSSRVAITSLTASQGLIWVGTNTGHILTIPVPILEGIPQQSGKANLSSLCHSGPVRFISTIQCSITFAPKGLSDEDLLEEPVHCSRQSLLSIDSVDFESESHIEPSQPLTSKHSSLEGSKPGNLKVPLSKAPNTMINRLGGMLTKPKNFAVSTPNLARSNFTREATPYTPSGLQRSSLGIYNSLMRLDDLDDTTSTTQLVSSLVPTNQLPQERQFTKISTVRGGSVKVTKASSIADLAPSQLRPLSKNKRSGVQSMWSLNTTSSHSVSSVAVGTDDASKVKALTLDKAYTNVNVELRDEEDGDRYMQLSDLSSGKFGGRLPIESQLSVSSLLSKVAEDDEYIDDEDLSPLEESTELGLSDAVYTEGVFKEDENLDGDEVDGKEEALVITNFLKASLIVSGGEGFLDLHEPGSILNESTLIMWQQNKIL